VDTLQKLKEAWPIVKWFDDARWSQGNSSSLIPGPVFQALKPSQQILTHLLAYINDLQRPWEEVWNNGGPVLAELVEDYGKINRHDEVLDLLRSHTTLDPQPGKHLDFFYSKQQTTDGIPIQFKSRFGTNMLSMARTLDALIDYEKDPASYFKSNLPFIFSHGSCTDDTVIARIAYLIDLLTYDRTHKDFQSFHTQAAKFELELKTTTDFLQNHLSNKIKLEQDFHWWLDSSRRFNNKRLWATLRDWIKPGSQFEPVFILSLNNATASQLSQYMKNNRRDVLSSLELPGDLWNMRFNQALFNNTLRPRELRNYYNQLLSRGFPRDLFYPEQFDISFDFTRRMCEVGQKELCPFKNGVMLSRYCLKYSTGNGKGSNCSIAKLLCGYNMVCEPTNCLIGEGKIVDICAGC
jgi:hypothetical protein